MARWMAEIVMNTIVLDVLRYLRNFQHRTQFPLEMNHLVELILFWWKETHVAPTYVFREDIISKNIESSIVTGTAGDYVKHIHVFHSARVISEFTIEYNLGLHGNTYYPMTKTQFMQKRGVRNCTISAWLP